MIEDNESFKLFKDINQFNKTETTDGRIYCCDGLCVAAAIDPDIVTKRREVYGEVVTEGKVTEGAIFFNHSPELLTDFPDPNIVLLNGIDHDKYVDMLENALK